MLKEKQNEKIIYYFFINFLNICFYVGPNIDFYFSTLFLFIYLIVFNPRW